MFTSHSFSTVNLFIYGFCIPRFNQHPNKNIWKKKNSESSTKQNLSLGISLVIQWLRLYTITAGGAGFIPGLGSKILHAA